MQCLRVAVFTLALLIQSWYHHQFRNYIKYAYTCVSVCMHYGSMAKYCSSTWLQAIKPFHLHSAFEPVIFPFYPVPLFLGCQYRYVTCCIGQPPIPHLDFNSGFEIFDCSFFLLLQLHDIPAREKEEASPGKFANYRALFGQLRSSLDYLSSNVCL